MLIKQNISVVGVIDFLIIHFKAYLCFNMFMSVYSVNENYQLNDYR
jgi:hypothetical protein